MSMTLENWLKDKPFTLCLSSGYFGFFAHCGLLYALEEKGLRPAKVTGASAGALIAGIWASGVSIEDIKAELFQLQRNQFWDPKMGFGLLEGELFRKKLDSLLKVKNFEDCEVPFVASVFNVNRLRTETISTGPLNQAIRASCALPALFQPVKIGSHFYLDGGARDKAAIQGTSKNERTLQHYLASKSPWRLPGGDWNFPNRENGCTVVVKDLPRSGPYRLKYGIDAFDLTRQTTLDLLEGAVTNNGSVILGKNLKPKKSRPFRIGKSFIFE